jgi:hypothetical protein
MGTLPVLPYQRTEAPHALTLRGHTLLCLQGFRGKGYSQHFIENLAAVQLSLLTDPGQPVEVTDRGDVVCGACPHQAATGCSLNGIGSEGAIRAQDHDVLRRLGLAPGDRLAWKTILDRIAASITGDSLDDICGQCRWLSLGYCREGIERLRGRGTDGHDTNGD